LYIPCKGDKYNSSDNNDNKNNVQEITENAPLRKEQKQTAVNVGYPETTQNIRRRGQSPMAETHTHTQ
jgi:hypothetical protein